MATTSSTSTSSSHPAHAHDDAAKPPAPTQRSTAAPKATTSIWQLAPINPLEPPFYLANVPSTIIVAAADAQQARAIASQSALTSLDGPAWLDEGLSSCDVLAPEEPGIVARDFSPIAPVVPVVDLGPPPVNKDVPHATPEGTVAVGTKLTCTMGNWDNMSVEPHSYAYAWQRDGSPSGIGGEIYDVLPPDVGHVLTCVVTATNPAGSTAAPPSNAVTVSDGA